MHKKIDKPFLVSIILLLVAGFFIFSSASLGLLATSESKFTAVAFNQIFFGLGLGTIACIATACIPFKYWKKYSLLIFGFTAFLAALVFVPHIGWSHGGAARWIGIFGFNFQPSELLKIGYVFYLAAVLSKYKARIKEFKYGLMPFVIITGIVGALILTEPDNDTFFMTALAGFGMYFVAGARMKHLAMLFLVAVIGFGCIIMIRPYVLSRIMTFINPSQNALTSGYQIQQSLIAIGTGGLFGKGFGQSSQKFNFLPEPIGDSIFAVAGEEFGMLGCILIICLFLFLALRGLKIASKMNDDFGRLVAVGIIILITAGSFLNIAAMLAIIPLTGTPLIFISQGGTAMFIALAEVGIILSLSRKQKQI
ncbi:MAG: spoVE [Candidatus Taylorbacteria bacterium]|nr:spoVE [Candidatus Taylorbacteria bacterium]